MSDFTNLEDVGGDEPDTIDGRLAGITRLVDTFDDEIDLGRRRLRREIIVHLLARLRDDVELLTATLLARLEDQ